MKFFKKQSIHERKIGDRSIVLTADGNVEIDLGESKNVNINGNLRVTGDTTGPKVSNVYYVTTDGSDLNDGRSAGADGAFASIKKAAEVAPEGSTIIVAPGDYYEENPIVLRDFVTVSGQGELRNTRVFPKNNTQTIFYVGNGCYLYQITFRGLRSPGWCVEIRPGTLCTTSPYVQNCTNMNGPWLNDGTEFIPFETVQLENVEPGARPLMVEDYPDLPLAKQVNDTGGGGGMYVDGDAYNPASLVFSMVADAFTQIAQGGIGFWIDNFGYTQIVSCFTVFCSTGFKTTRGGYLSISNSVSDFGTFGCVSDGFYPVAYSNALADENYTSSVGSVTITSPGSGYTGTPLVTFEPPTAPGGVQATGTATVDLTTGQIAAVTITNNGSGYEKVPQVTFSGGGAGIQAIGRVNLQSNSEITISSLRDKPQTGSIIQFQGDDTYYYITSVDITEPPFIYDETVCRRDVRRIVDAVAGDIVLGTNYQSITAAQSYLRSTAGKVILDQLAPTIYGIESARDEMKAQTSNLAMREEIDQRFNIITSVLSAGDSTGLPTIVYNDLSTISQSTINAKNNIVENRDFIIDELTAYINDQFTELSYNQTEYRTDMTNLINGIAMYAVLGSDQQVIRQAQEFETRARFKPMMVSSFNFLKGKFLDQPNVIASATGYANTEEGWNQFINIVDDGDSAGVTIEFPEHVGVEANRADAKDHLQANKDFIKAEFVAFIADDNPLWSFDTVAFDQDMAYIIDALTFDMLYGGNSSTVQEAIYYFNNNNGFTNLLDSEKQTLVDAFARIRFVLQRVVRGLPVTPTVSGSEPNTESQDFTSSDATAIESNIADGLLQIIEDVVNNASLSELPTKSYPLYASEPSDQQDAATTILTQRDFFIEDAVAYNLANNPTLTYNVEKCKRDVGYLVDAVYRDAQLSTNHNSITAALAYNRANTAYLNSEQKPATIIAMREAKRLTVAAASRDAIFQQSVSILFDDILNIIEFDQLPSEGTVFEEPGPASQELIDAVNQVIANRSFLQEEVIAWINDNNFVYDQAKCERDTNLILDAASYDAALGTNYNAVTSGLAYTRANSAYVLSDQKTETVGAITFARGEAETATGTDLTVQSRVTAAFNEIIDIINNGTGAADALSFPAPTGASTALQNAAQQLQNNRQFLAQEAVAYIQNNYQNFTYDQAKCERDVGLIMDAVALDVALGTNYNSVTAGLAYQRASSADLQDTQKIQTLAALRELKKQIVLLGLSDIAQPRAEALMDEIIDILDNGVISTDTSADALVFPAPTGVNVDKVSAKNQLIANKDFIKAEIISWINTNYPALVYDDVKCARDIGYIIDALCHDILYGGNSATIQAAQSYFVGAVSQLGAGQAAATAAAFNRLGQVVGDVAIEANVVKTGVYAENQDTSGTAASSTEVDELSALVTIIEDVITAGNISGLPSTTLPSVLWTSADLQQAYSVIKGNKTDVQEKIIIFIANNFQSFVYDQAKCERDVGILVEAAAYDAVLGTNYNSVTAGLAYQRANSAYVLSDQNLQTIKAIEFLRDSMLDLDISSQTKSSITTSLNEVLDIIQNGVESTAISADAITFTNPTGGSVNDVFAKNQLQINKDFFKAEIVAYLANSYPGLVYNQTKCERDIEYIIDAFSYDILYGGNLATKQAAEAYFVGTVSQLGAGQALATRDAYIELKAIISDVVQAILYAPTNQSPVVVSQDISGTGADAGTAGEVQNLVQIIIDVIANGTTVGMPADQPPSISWASISDQTDYLALIGATATLQSSVINYIDNTFTRDFTFDTAKCARDTGYIVDALTYDLLYGGNSATYEAAKAYWVGATTQVSGQQNETSDSLGWISTIVESVILDTVYSDPEQTVVSQNTAAGAGTSTEVTAVQDLIETIQNVIVNGTDELPTKTYPDLSWTSSSIQTTVQALQFSKETIISDTIDYIQTTYGGFSYNQDLCRRDTGYFVDAITHDLLYTGNIATLIATRAYYLGAVEYLPDSQAQITANAYGHLADIVEACIEGIAVSPTTGNPETQVLSGDYGTATQSTTAINLINILKDTIQRQASGNPTPLVGTPSEIEPDFSWLPLETKLAASVMLSEKVNIQNSVIDYITDNIVGFEYNVEKCQRDTGYIIDATIYDMMYGGNKQTRRAAEAYYNGAILGAARVGNSDQTLVTAYTYYYLADVISKVAKNELVTKSYGNGTAQIVTVPDSDTVPADNAALLIDRIGQSLIEETTSGWQEVDHNYSLGSTVYNNERLTILDNLQTIEDNAIADLNATYGGTATIKLFPGIISVSTTQLANLYNVSTISTSGHAFEYVGAGITYNALPFFGGSAIPENEIVEAGQGKVFAGGTVDQIGNFRVGNFFNVNALTGAITLNANQIDLSGLTSVGPFIRDNIPVGVELKEVSDNTNLIASTGIQDPFTAPTQRAVSVYVENRYLNKLTGGTVDGDTIFASNIEVNGGTLDTTNGTFDLINDNASTVNFAGGATTITIGADVGTTTIRNNLDVDGDLSIVGDIAVIGDTSFVIPDEIQQAFSITEGTEDYISIDTRENFESVTFGEQPVIRILNQQESTTFDNGALVVDGGVAIGKNLNIGGNIEFAGTIIATESSELFLFNDVAGEVRAFGDATEIEVGSSGIVPGNFIVNNDYIRFTSVYNLKLPAGSTGERGKVDDYDGVGYIRFNTDLGIFEGYDGIAWNGLGGVRDVDGNTYISAEDSPGANNNELKFFVDGAQRLILTTSDFILDNTITNVTLEGTTESTSPDSGVLVVEGGVGIEKNLNVRGDVRLYNDLLVEGPIVTTGSLTVGTFDSVVDTFTANANIDLNVYDNTNDAFDISEGVNSYFNVTTTNGSETITFGTLPVIRILNEDESNDLTDGAVVISGGLAVTKNLNIGGDFYYEGSTFSTNSTLLNLFDDVVTEVNAFGNATDITLGNNSTPGNFTVNNDYIVFTSTNNMKIPTGTTAQRGTTASEGYIRFNTDLGIFEGYDGIAWNGLGGIRDIDGNTYISAEDSPGANNNELKFFVDGTQRAILTTQDFILDNSIINVVIEGTTESNSPDTGVLVVEGGIGIEKNLNVRGDIRGYNNALIEGNLTATGSVTLGTLDSVIDSFEVNANSQFNVWDNTIDAFDISEGINSYFKVTTTNLSETITFGTTPVVRIDNTTESTDSLTGALVIAGGMGVNGNVFITGTLQVDGSLIFGDNVTLDTIAVSGDADFDIPDDTAEGFKVHQSTTDYFTINTSNGSESVDFGTTPIVNILNTTDSSDKDTGALVVDGGVGIELNANIGIDLFVGRNTELTGDLAVNGGDLTTNQTTFNLINTDATTVNFAGAATTINIGAATGTITFNNEYFVFDSVQAIKIPVGETGDRPTAAAGQLRFNTTTDTFEGYDGTAWGSLGGVIDVDRNTFIRPETSPGANNNELEFFTDGARRAIISNTEFNIEDTNIVNILNTTNATDYQTGALVVTGGVGIAKDLYVQGFISGNNSGVLQLTDLASDKLYIKADTIESPEQIKWIANSPDSAADDIVYPITLAHHSVSGTPVNGSGTGLKFELETTNDNFEIGGQIDVVVQDITGTQEDFDMVFSTMINGTAAVEKLRLGELTSTFSTDVTINNDQLLTTQTTFNLINDTATTINFAGAATALNIGASGGLTTIDQSVQVNEDVTIDGTLVLTNVDLEVQYGGTGVSTFTTDGILYGDGANPVQVTDAAGTSDTSESFQVLTVVGGGDNTPVWTDTIDGGTF